MKIKSIFQIIQGHQITDEEIYRAEGNIPVITGRDEIKGYWNKKIIERGDLPCITYPTKANAGDTYIQTKIFDANNTAVLIPFPKWREKVDLEWISYKLRTMFLKIQTSKAGVSYLNKEIVEELEINIPSKDIQEKERYVISKLLYTKRKVCKILEMIERINSLPISTEYNKYQGKEIPAKVIFGVINGNSELTEEVIYQHIEVDENSERYEVLSSSTVDRTRMGYVAKFKIKKKTIKTFEDKEGILVIRNGKAGKAYYLTHGKYTLNDHAYILYVKESCDYKINLKWFICQYQNSLYQFSSFSDNATWNKTGFFKHAVFDIPSLEEQEEVEKRFKCLQNYENRLSSINNKIDSVLNREISEEIPNM